MRDSSYRPSGSWELVEDYFPQVLAAGLVLGLALLGSGSWLIHAWIIHRPGAAGTETPTAADSGRAAETAPTGTETAASSRTVSLNPTGNPSAPKPDWPTPVRDAAASQRPFDIEHTENTTKTERWRSITPQDQPTPPGESPPASDRNPPAGATNSPSAPPAASVGPPSVSAPVLPTSTTTSVPQAPPAMPAAPHPPRPAQPPVEEAIVDRPAPPAPPAPADNGPDEPTEKLPPVVKPPTPKKSSKSAVSAVRAWSPQLERAWQRDQARLRRVDAWRDAQERRLVAYRQVTERLRQARQRAHAVYSSRIDALGTIDWPLLLRSRYAAQVREIEAAIDRQDSIAVRNWCDVLIAQLRSDLSARRLTGVPVAKYLESRDFLAWLRAKPPAPGPALSDANRVALRNGR